MSPPVDRAAAAAAIESFLRAIGRDPATEPELQGTGARVAAAFLDDLTRGYGVDATELLARDALDGTSDVVVARGLTIATTCPHHLMSAWGTATVAFAPRHRLVGVGAIVRALDAVSRRLTLQETIGQELVRAVEAALEPRWAACRIVLTHGCMVARGRGHAGAQIETVALSPSSLGDAERQLAWSIVRGG
jgi:GTP cyclohydrolase I